MNLKIASMIVVKNHLYLIVSKDVLQIKFGEEFF